MQQQRSHLKRQQQQQHYQSSPPLEQEAHEASEIAEMPLSPLGACVRLEAMDELERENMGLLQALGHAESNADALRDELRQARASAANAARERDWLRRELAALRVQPDEGKTSTQGTPK